MRREKEAEGVLWGNLAKQHDDQKKLLRMSEISLWIDDYDDIFSDFDPRPFAVRALSDDFLLEARKAVVAKPDGKPELKFLIPVDKRDITIENIIKRRLRDHFARHFSLEQKESRKILTRAVSMIVLGVVMMIGAATLSFWKDEIFIWHVLRIILEPGGWFTVWTGMDQIFYELRQNGPDLEFYKKMNEAEITFNSY